MRCALTLSYNGTHYLGSQSQKETSNTILGTLEKVLIQLGINSKIVASGRTDKGVHATGQVCHIDLPKFWKNLSKLHISLNKMLPSSIQINSIKEVPLEFHARYSAKRRVYRYIISTKKKNPFNNDYITYLDTFDNVKVQSNIKLFIGEHDFSHFMKTGSDINSTKRIIYKAFTYKYNDCTVLYFEGNGFLRSQIRLMVGALFQLDSKSIKQQLSCLKRYKVKPAPSNGLYLAKIKY